MTNEFLVQVKWTRNEFIELPNPEGLHCTACDEVADVLCFTAGRKGPFCLKCFEKLCDPDQALLLEERLAQYESQAESGEKP